ncbi:MAG: hypothetical protein PVJ77_24920, partial [Desulfobacterales bacterium]
SAGLISASHQRGVFLKRSLLLASSGCSCEGIYSVGKDVTEVDMIFSVTRVRRVDFSVEDGPAACFASPASLPVVFPFQGELSILAG